VAAFNVFAADTDAEAKRLFTSLQQAFLGIIRGARTELQPPVDGMDGKWTLQEQSHVKGMTRVSAVGSPETVRTALETLLTDTGADELIVTSQIYDHAARLRSFELSADVFKSINATNAAGAKARQPSRT
jgi:alkanesulfonate monooxygenase SsuD/methylene tetrahydromethanopterin reductase-like flavin-dependent oxidoreductase (luciferase family)